MLLVAACVLTAAVFAPLADEWIIAISFGVLISRYLIIRKYK